MEFTRKEIEFLDLINMGLPSMGDVALAMRVGPSCVSGIKANIIYKDPGFDIEFYNTKIDSAVEMRFEGIRWKDVAKILGYKDAHTAAMAIINRYGSLKNIKYLAPTSDSKWVRK